MRRDARRWAPVAFAVVAACPLVFLALLPVVDVVPPSAFDTGRPLDELPFVTSNLLTAVVGGVLARRRPHNPVGWLLLLLALGFSAYAALVMVVQAAGVTAESPAGVRLLAWTGNWSWMLSHVAIVFVLLLFPDGDLPSRRWRPVAWTAVTVFALQVLLAALHPRLEVVPDAANPLGLGAATAVPIGPLILATFVLEIVAAGSLVVRYRTSRATTRLQLRWVALGAAVTMTVSAAMALIGVLGVAAGAAWVRWVDGMLGLPIVGGVAVAILRHRLYEIDRLVSRTVTYGILTAVVAGVYVLVAVVPSAVFSLESDLLVAAATLAAAAVSVPAHRRVQAVVDRRFNRARYDARRVVEGFGSRLRADLDVAHLTADLRRVVGATVQPARVSLWLVDDRS